MFNNERDISKRQPEKAPTSQKMAQFEYIIINNNCDAIILMQNTKDLRVHNGNKSK